MLSKWFEWSDNGPHIVANVIETFAFTVRRLLVLYEVCMFSQFVHGFVEVTPVSAPKHPCWGIFLIRCSKLTIDMNVCVNTFMSLYVAL